MQLFNEMQWLAIMLANHAGQDKLEFEDRLQWFRTNRDQLELLVPTNPKEKFPYLKALKALRDIEAGKETRYIGELDATNSGSQVMAVLGKCRVTAQNSNIIGQQRNDLYQKINDSVRGVTLTRKQVKEATIPAIFGSQKEPMKLLGEDSPELKAFWKALDKEVPVLKFLTRICRDYIWNDQSLYHQWTLKDGHVAYCPTMVRHEAKLNIGGKQFTFQYLDNAPSENSIPLLVNIVHSFDAYKLREMVRMANDPQYAWKYVKPLMKYLPNISKGMLVKFKVGVNHDAFSQQLRHMNLIRLYAIAVDYDLAKGDELNRVLKEINPSFCGIQYTKEELELHHEVALSNYSLC